MEAAVATSAGTQQALEPCMMCRETDHHPPHQETDDVMATCTSGLFILTGQSINE
jgi:hypothetical protein